MPERGQSDLNSKYQNIWAQRKAFILENPNILIKQRDWWKVDDVEGESFGNNSL